MDLAQVPATIARLWDTMPADVGPAWPIVFPEVARVVGALADATDDDQRAMLSLELIRTFARFPEVMAPLAAITAPDRAQSEPADWPTAIAALRGRLDPPTGTREVELHAPGRLTVGGRGFVVVDLVAAQAAPGLAAELVTDFAVAGEAVRRFDAGPVMFRITARSAGEKHLRVDLRQDGRVVGGLTCTILVGEEDGAGTTDLSQQASGSFVVGGRYVPPPDLEMRVHLVRSGGGLILRYVLHSPTGVASHHHDPVGETLLTASPEDYRTDLLTRIEGLAPDRVADKLRAYGEMLYRDLLPAPLRAAYLRFRDEVRTLQIVSDEPWIPWELVRPYADGPGSVDDDFWGARFALARWLPGDSGPGTELRLHRLACVEAGSAPGQARLPAAAREVAAVTALATAHGVADASPAAGDIAAVSRLLEDPTIGGWHFATHGDLDPERPDQAALILADGESLSPEDLYGARQSAIGAARPVVFLNACRAGAQGFSLVRLGGWADAWVRRCRAGAFIGPAWAVSDRPALHFAKTFYEHLLTGSTLGESTRAAREATRRRWPNDLTWLAYTLYGHPNARAGQPVDSR
jgi:hypothetical protein